MMQIVKGKVNCRGSESSMAGSNYWFVKLNQWETQLSRSSIVYPTTNLPPIMTHNKDSQL